MRDEAVPFDQGVCQTAEPMAVGISPENMSKYNAEPSQTMRRGIRHSVLQREGNHVTELHMEKRLVGEICGGIEYLQYAHRRFDIRIGGSRQINQALDGAPIEAPPQRSKGRGEMF